LKKLACCVAHAPNV